jgi:hypothetical protein
MALGPGRLEHQRCDALADWPLVLLRLDAVGIKRLEELITDAWHMRAPNDIRTRPH